MIAASQMAKTSRLTSPGLAWPRPLILLAILVVAFVAAVPDSFVRAAGAAEPALSAAQFAKINGWIAEKGRDVAVSAIITDILGLTKDNQTISCRAFAAVDAGTNDVYQIYLLPDGKGYLEDHFHQDKVDIYWTDKDMVLIAALSGVRGELPGLTSFQQAQFGLGNELQWWAKYADTH